eukprot:gene2300-biopygen12507
MSAYWACETRPEDRVLRYSFRENPGPATFFCFPAAVIFLLVHGHLKGVTQNNTSGPASPLWLPREAACGTPALGDPPRFHGSRSAPPIRGMQMIINACCSAYVVVARAGACVCSLARTCVHDEDDRGAWGY